MKTVERSTLGGLWVFGARIHALADEVVSKPLHGMHARVDDNALRDLRDRRKRHARTRRDLPLRNRAGIEAGHHVVVEVAGAIHGYGV